MTSVAAAESGSSVSDATVKIEDWLNASIGDGDFGEEIAQFTLVVISVYDDAEKNGRWVQTHEKLGVFKDFATGKRIPFLSVAVSVLPATVQSLLPRDLLSHICHSATERLTVRPKRLPRNFDFQNFARCVSTALEVYVL